MFKLVGRAAVLSALLLMPAAAQARGGAVASATVDGETENFTSVQDAFDAVDDGGTVKLLASVTEYPLYVSFECAFDLNGFTLTGVILPDEDFTVLDSSGDDSGSIELPVLAEGDDVEGEEFLDGAVWTGYGYGTVTIGGGTYYNPVAVLWANDAELVITGGVFHGAAVVPDTEWAEDYSSENPCDIDSTVTVTGGRFFADEGNADMFLVRDSDVFCGVALNISGGLFTTLDGSEPQLIDLNAVTLTGGCYSEAPGADFVAEDCVAVANNDPATVDDYPWTVKAAGTEAYITAIEADDARGRIGFTVRLPDGMSSGVVKVWGKVNYSDRFWSQIGEARAADSAAEVAGAQLLHYTMFTATVGASVQSGLDLKGGNVVGTLKVALADNEDCPVAVPYSPIGGGDGGITLSGLFQASALKDGDLVRVFPASGGPRGYKWDSGSGFWRECRYDVRTRTWNAEGTVDAGARDIGSLGAVAFYRAGGGTVRINGEIRSWGGAQPWADPAGWAAKLDSGDGWNLVRGADPAAVNVQDIPYLGLGGGDTLWITASDGVLRELKWDGAQWYYMKLTSEGGWGKADTKVTTGLAVQAGAAFWYVNDNAVFHE
ncbi:MAG: hypothetical protein IJU44_07670 [Kiritimatiellae bacterium]|nr:hypothetical protein [Kiritimatiellia bacterium]